MKKVIVNDKMQQGYEYVISKGIGEDFHPEFKPELTPKEMLELEVFCGKYMTDCKKEFPESWFENAKLSSEKKNCNQNYFKIKAKAGYMKKTLGDGFSSIVDTIWEGD